MSKLKEKTSLLKARKVVNNIKGISSVSFFTKKPVEITWYAGELNLLDNDIPCAYRLPYDIDIKYLSFILERESAGESHFIMGFLEATPVYISFHIDSFYDFIYSFYREANTRYITLFFFNKRKIIDVFLAEHKLEIKVLDRGI